MNNKLYSSVIRHCLLEALKSSLQNTTSLDFLKLVKLRTALDLKFLCYNAQPLALPLFLPADHQEIVGTNKKKKKNTAPIKARTSQQ